MRSPTELHTGTHWWGHAATMRKRRPQRQGPDQTLISLCTTAPATGRQHNSTEEKLEEPILVVLEGLQQLFPTVHDEWTVLENGLSYGCARHQHKAETLRPGSDG